MEGIRRRGGIVTCLAHRQPTASNGDAGDKYTGLDRFDRVVDQRWIKTSTGTATDRFQYGYDRDGNRLYRNNLVNSSFGELYHANGASNGYDNLNQLQAFARGTLNAGHDTVSSTLAFDANGNMTTDDNGKTLVYDAWNRLVAYKNAGTTLASYKYDAFG